MIQILQMRWALAAMVLLLFGCSSSPSDPAKESAAPVATPKPRADLGTAELSPPNGSGTEATLRLTIKRGMDKPVLIGLLINDRQNGGNACYVFHNFAENDNSLVADSGSGATPLGKAKSVLNRQCELLHEGTGSTEDATGTIATFHIRFLPGFRGSKHIWVYPSDATGNSSGFQDVGTWTVQ